MTPDPDHALEVLLQTARSHGLAGRTADAMAAYEELLRQRPALPDSWYNLALLRRRAGKFDGALMAYQHALDHGISQPEEVHLNRGVIHADDLRQFEAAESALALALQANPAYVPALLNLGNLHEDLGRHDAARTVYERLLAIDPSNVEALARLASLQVGIDPHHPLVARLRRAIGSSHSQSSAADRASLGFALGKLLDAAGAHDAAFAAYVDANAASRASVPAAVSHYDRQSHERFIDRLMTVFAEAASPPAAQPPAMSAPTGQRPPIFICGMFRSGSTLAEQMLAAHPGVVSGGEISLLPELVRTQLHPYPESMRHRSAQQLEHLASIYRAHLRRLAPGPGPRQITDKRPDNYLHIGLIKRLFPEARIVHTTRSPLDNVLSINFLHLDPSMGYALDLLDTGHHYRQYRRLMTHWKALYGADILDFDYDALVTAPRPQLERLLDFCGLDRDDACLDFQRNPNGVRTASAWQVRQPLYRSSSGRWRHYASHLVPLMEMLKVLD